MLESDSAAPCFLTTDPQLELSMPSVCPGHLKHSQLRDFLQQPSPVSIDGDSWTAVEASCQTVSRVIAAGKTVYGLNTGFGMLANQKISPENLARLQVNLVRSHAAGCGELLPDPVVRLVMLLKATSLARGYSGVRREVIELLLGMLNADVLPCIPGQGSVGASGDLAPLAHMSLAMIGEGRVRVTGNEEHSREALARNALHPIELGPKEGLALLNGTQVSTSLALAGLYAAEQCLIAGIMTGAMSVDAVMGSDTPFDARIHAIRNHPAQEDCARWFRTILAGSEIRESHRECARVQDPYSLRCQPQVMGACLESLRHAAEVLLREANAVSDNPLVFGDDDAILSGGNFHAEPVAMAADQIAVALAEIGALSERRIALLIDQHLSGLPAFLVKEGGLNSGFMIPQVTAAALASENKHLASPVSVDSLPTSANQEDHVSMATYAARRLEPMARNTSMILAIELLAASQGIDFRAPMKTSPMLQELHRKVRNVVPHYDADRVFAEDMRKVAEQVILDMRVGSLFDGTVIA